MIEYRIGKRQIRKEAISWMEKLTRNNSEKLFVLIDALQKQNEKVQMIEFVKNDLKKAEKFSQQLEETEKIKFDKPCRKSDEHSPGWPGHLPHEAFLPNREYCFSCDLPTSWRRSHNL